MFLPNIHASLWLCIVSEQEMIWSSQYKLVGVSLHHCAVFETKEAHYDDGLHYCLWVLSNTAGNNDSGRGQPPSIIAQVCLT